MNSELQLAFNDLDTVLNEKYHGIVSNEFVQLVSDTKEDIKTKKQMHKSLSNELSLEIDRAFDNYIEEKK